MSWSWVGILPLQRQVEWINSRIAVLPWRSMAACIWSGSNAAKWGTPPVSATEQESIFGSESQCWIRALGFPSFHSAVDPFECNLAMTCGTSCHEIAAALNFSLSHSCAAERALQPATRFVRDCEMGSDKREYDDRQSLTNEDQRSIACA